MYLGWTRWVYPRYFVHFLVMYLQCTGLVNEPLSPVGVTTSGIYKQESLHDQRKSLTQAIEDLRSAQRVYCQNQPRQQAY